MDKAVNELKLMVDSLIAEKNSILGCNNTENAQPGCKIMFSFLASSLRVTSLQNTFVQVMASFLLTVQHPSVVGVNLVGPEHDILAVRFYNDHMNIYGHFKNQHPSVKISLHAGELRQGLVTPETIRSGRIQKAIQIAGASRIGHGVAIGFEPAGLNLMNMMASKGVLVEICLTSNAMLLDVVGNAHPFPYYRRMGVPVSLNTDDEGILRTDITNEFIRAVQTYNLSLADLEKMSRDSLEHSFLSGKGLWHRNAAGHASVVPECRKCSDIRTWGSPFGCSECTTYLKKNSKARLQAKLERDLKEHRKQSSERARSFLETHF